MLTEWGFAGVGEHLNLRVDQQCIALNLERVRLHPSKGDRRARPEQSAQPHNFRESTNRPQTTVAIHDETLAMIEQHRLEAVLDLLTFTCSRKRSFRGRRNERGISGRLQSPLSLDLALERADFIENRGHYL